VTECEGLAAEEPANPGALRIGCCSPARSLHPAALEQFQEKWKPVFRPELRQNNALDRIIDCLKR
jgi:hypothetical protein